MSRRAIAGALLGGALLASLTACTGFPVPDDVATYAKQGDGGADALLEGTLVRDDGCTYIEDPSTGVRVLPVFAAGSVTWGDDDRLIVRNQSYAVGETAGFGGADGAAGPALELDIPEACDSSVDRWLVN